MREQTLAPSSSARCAARTQPPRRTSSQRSWSPRPNRPASTSPTTRSSARSPRRARDRRDSGARLPVLVAAAAVVVVGAAFLFLRAPGDGRAGARARGGAADLLRGRADSPRASPGSSRRARSRASSTARAGARTCGSRRAQGSPPRSCFARTGVSRAGSRRATRSPSQPRATGYRAAAREALDPLTLYTRTLADDGVTSTRVGDTYRLTIRGARLDEIVVVDARFVSAAPIEWRRGGRLVSRPVPRARTAAQSAPDADTWRLDEHPRAVVRQYGRGGRPVRVLAVRPGVTRCERPLARRGIRRRARTRQRRRADGRTRDADRLRAARPSGTSAPSCRRRCCKAATRPRRSLRSAAASRTSTTAPGRRSVAEAHSAVATSRSISTDGEKVDAVRALQQLRLRGSP